MNRAALRSMQHVYLITLQPLLSDYHTKLYHNYTFICMYHADLVQIVYASQE